MQVFEKLCCSCRAITIRVYAFLVYELVSGLQPMRISQFFVLFDKLD
jgi:hypothetical protein